MKIIFSDFKKGVIKIQLTDAEDFWYLNQLIEAGDILSGRTIRKLTIGTEGRTTHVQKQVYLKITVERVELAGDSLRASGKIIEGPDDVPHGSYHTFTIENYSEITLEKQEWLSIHKTQLNEAQRTAQAPVIICVFDRDDALIARSSLSGMEVLMQLRGDPERKEKRAQTKIDLYKEIITALNQYNTRLNPQYIILASPAFYKDDLAEQITDQKLRQKIILATCSSAGENAIHEVLRRPETQHALKQVRIVHETEIVDKLLVEIAKQGCATYGFEYVKTAAEAGAVSDILITSSCIKQFRENGKFKELNDIMKRIEQLKGVIHIISTEHEAGKKLQGLGGIAALLRYKLEW